MAPSQATRAEGVFIALLRYDHEKFQGVAAGIAEAVRRVGRDHVYLTPADPRGTPEIGERPGVAAAQINDEHVFAVKVQRSAIRERLVALLATSTRSLSIKGETFTPYCSSSASPGVPLAAPRASFNSIAMASTRAGPRFETADAPAVCQTASAGIRPSGSAVR